MSVFNAYMALSGRVDADVRRSEPLARHTSLRIGGPAALFVTAHDLAALTRTIAVLAEEGVPWVLLGRGTNILASDDGHPGCVICLGREFDRMEVDGTTLTAGAAAKLSGVVQAAMNAGLAGLDFLAGIPGTVGGAVRMDAGTRDEWIGSVLRDVVCLRPGQGLVRHDASEIAWGYRSTSLPEREVVLEASFSLAEGERALIAEAMQRRLARRRLRQPVGLASCGSVFRNPEGASAGRLVADCGLAGERVGGAQISELHANFIVNRGGATASDVCTLMARMHDGVLAASGHDLTPEVRLLGFEG